jgi:Glycosyl hydrolase catalytic core
LILLQKIAILTGGKFMKTISLVPICVLLLSGFCNALAAEPTRFTKDQLKLPGKKGACFTLKQEAGKLTENGARNLARVKALNVSWNYSWNTHHVSEQPKEIEFVPMIWTGTDKQKLQERIATEVTPNIKAGKSKRLLGFNEPDQKEQSNIPYTLALELWPALEKLGIPLCSPACANPEGIKDEKAKGVPGTWMRDFMKEADARGYRVDYIGVHSYGGTGAADFKAKMKRIYEKYGKRPLLITEFAVADWKTGGDIKKNRHSAENILKFMKEVIPWLEEQEWIAGYAWFSFKPDSAPGAPSALFDAEGNLTACGKYYRSVTPQNPKGDQTIKPDPIQQRDEKSKLQDL